MSQVDEKTAQQDLNLEVSDSAADEKVALDIEGADFLKDEDFEEAPQETAPAVREESLEIANKEEEKTDEEGKPKSKLKLIIILVLVLAIGGAAAWWFMFRTPPPPPVEPEIIVVPKTSTAPLPPSDHIISFEPYWVPLSDGKGGQVFLVCKFAIVTNDEKLQLEVQNKMILLRDAVYYYLVNKPYHFLIDHANVPTIKKDLASVFSGYLVSGEVEDMLFEGYIGK